MSEDTKMKKSPTEFGKQIISIFDHENRASGYSRDATIYKNVCQQHGANMVVPEPKTWSPFLPVVSAQADCLMLPIDRCRSQLFRNFFQVESCSYSIRNDSVYFHFEFFFRWTIWIRQSIDLGGICPEHFFRFWVGSSGVRNNCLQIKLIFSWFVPFCIFQIFNLF